MSEIRVIFTLILIFCYFFSMPNYIFGFDLDETVDDKIRKNYNADKLIDDVQSSTITRNAQPSPEEILPNLPNITNNKKNKNTSDIQGTNIVTPNIQYNYNKTGKYKIHSGTTFIVTNNSKISDWMSKGTNIQFKTTGQKNGRKYTIPASTTFYAKVIDVHQPQISCNGGLVAIEITGIRYHGDLIPVHGYVLRANDKKIFLGNIKGKRTYLSTTYKKGNWGRALFGRMFTLTVNLGKDGSTLLLSPFPLLYGTICLGANTLISPITAFFSKGGHVNIPQGSPFKIKITEDFYID